MSEKIENDIFTPNLPYCYYMGMTEFFGKEIASFRYLYNTSDYFKYEVTITRIQIPSQLDKKILVTRKVIYTPLVGKDPKHLTNKDKGKFFRIQGEEFSCNVSDGYKRLSIPWEKVILEEMKVESDEVLKLLEERS